jgi:hypothetical protein
MKLLNEVFQNIARKASLDLTKGGKTKKKTIALGKNWHILAGMAGHWTGNKSTYFLCLVLKKSVMFLECF